MANVEFGVLPEPDIDQESKTDFSVRLLGTGGPWLGEERFGPSVLIRCGSERLLFDTGRGVGIRLVQAGESPHLVNPIFITHHHIDHISDLADVLVTSWLYGRQQEMLVYGPTGTREIVDALMNTVYAKDIRWRSEGETNLGGWKPVRAVDLKPGQVVDNGTWRVTSAEMVHGHGLGFADDFLNKWVCMGYRIDFSGRSVVISGDTVDCKGIRELAKGADLLVQCCIAGREECEEEPSLYEVVEHTLADARQAATIAQDCGVSHLAITHHRPKSTAKLESMEAEIREIYRGKITMGTDLARLEL